MKSITYIAAGGVIIDDGRMLLLDRPSRGEVRLPKGHIDPGEDAEETALRETTEETGYVDIEIVEPLGRHVVEFEYEGMRVVRTEEYFLMRLRSDALIVRSPKDEAQFHVRWEPIESAPAQLTYAAEQAVARKAVQLYHAA